MWFLVDSNTFLIVHFHQRHSVKHSCSSVFANGSILRFVFDIFTSLLLFSFGHDVKFFFIPCISKIFFSSYLWTENVKFVNTSGKSSVSDSQYFLSGQHYPKEPNEAWLITMLCQFTNLHRCFHLVRLIGVKVGWAMLRITWDPQTSSSNWQLAEKLNWNWNIKYIYFWGAGGDENWARNELRLDLDSQHVTHVSSILIFCSNH